jgi:primosomal protein N' (replication factor Y)
VCVDQAPSHLDRPFTYAVPERWRGDVRPGVRVAVPFGGRDSPGWVLDVAAAPGALPGDADLVTPGTGAADPVGGAPLRPVRRVVSPLPVLDPAVARVARAVADRYGGSLADVLRTAVPPRHARAERALLEESADGSAPGADGHVGDAGRTVPELGGDVVDPGEWALVTGGAALLRRVAAGQDPAAAVRLPTAGQPWRALARLAAAAVSGGRTALLVVPDADDLSRLREALRAALPAARTVLLHHDHGPAARWRGHVAALLDRVDVVVGTRAAVFAPAPRLGVVAVWDDLDDAHVEPRSPGWHVREVALLRAREAGAALVLASHSRSAAAQQLVDRGLLRDLGPDRGTRRALAPRVVVPDPADPLESTARVPRSAHRVLADGLRRGPVLVSVPRRGGVPALRCGACGTRASCRHCGRGGLGVPGGVAVATCSWCGRDAAGWACPVCGHRRLRAVTVGAERTAHELGLAFPGHPVVTSDGGHRVAGVGPDPAVVVATPGTEPVAEGGYAATLALDADRVLARPGLAAGEVAVARWLHLASLTRAAPDGGRLVLVADPGAPEVQAVVADAPERYAERILAERAAARLPPAVTVAALTGDEAAVRQVLAWVRGDGTLDLDLDKRWTVEGSAGLEVLGPAPVAGNQTRALLVGRRADVIAAVRDVARRRSAGAEGRLTVRVDPADL